ncbi:MAG: hypothetical protein ACLVJO_11095 [[Clostridium] scindens]
MAYKFKDGKPFVDKRIEMERRPAAIRSCGMAAICWFPAYQRPDTVLDIEQGMFLQGNWSFRRHGPRHGCSIVITAASMDERMEQ